MENSQVVTTLGIFAAAVLLLVSNRLRNDVVAVLIILSLMLSGVLDVQEALSGFSSTAVVIIACMYVVGKAVTHTGIAQRVGEGIVYYGGQDERKLLLMVMAAAATIGAFMSSTATAAIFIPITLAVSEKAGINPKRLLMPLAVASLISGMMTLVATTPNIIVNSVLQEQTGQSFSFFSITPFGIAVLVLAMGFMLLAGRGLLGSKDRPGTDKRDPGIDDLLRRHGIIKNEYMFRITEYSGLIGRSAASLQLNASHHVILLAVQRKISGRRQEIMAARPGIVFQAGDILMLIGDAAHMELFAEEFALRRFSPSPSQRRKFFQVVGIAEVMISPESNLLGKSLRAIRFQSVFHSMALGVRRKREALTHDIADLPLKTGDVLLVCGAWDDLMLLRQHKEDYLLLTIPNDYREVVPAQNRQLLAVLILLAMVTSLVLNLVPPVAAILAAASALLLTRCAPIGSVYEVIDWQTIVLIAGILPLALALQKTGITGWVSGRLLEAFAEAEPLFILGGLYLVTIAMGTVLSNTAVAILMAPMAVSIGTQLQVSPQACAMAVAVGCSAAFLSPLGSPVNMIIREPGGYGFGDYLRIGMPLVLLTLAVLLGLSRVLYLA